MNDDANPIVLAFAAACIIGGAALFLTARRRERSMESANLISWVLIALFPVLVLFSFFPGSDVTLEYLGLSATGAVAAFVFIWLMGKKRGELALRIDGLEQEVDELKAELESMRTAKNPTALRQTTIHRYGVAGAEGKEVNVVTGNLTGIKSVDVWVNSENTNMQMPSFFDRSISGTIRYYGGRRNAAGHVTDDVIAKALAREMDGNLYVAPGTVFVTESGELERTHNVKKVFHVAAVQGQAGVGYRQIEDVHCCVVNALERMDELNRGGASLRSIVFPFLGTGQARGDPKATAASLVGAAVEYLRDHPATEVEQVFFLAYTDADLEVWREALESAPHLALKGARRRKRVRAG